MVVNQRPLRAPRHLWRGEAGGFALVTTLAIVVLLFIVTLGILSLSAITVRAGGQDLYTMEARANARLALQLAIGELQKQLGPDQRISAPASIMDDDVGSEGIDRVRHPHWVGVWSHLDEDGDSVWTRNDAEGGLYDRRQPGQWNREDHSLSYLVSGNEGGRRQAERFRDAMDNNSLTDPVTMVGKGSLGSHAGVLRQDMVQVQRVPISAGNTNGHFAYWVGDLGVRANIATKNRYEGNENPAASRFRVMAAQEAALEVMDYRETSLPPMEEEEKGKLISAQATDFHDEDAPAWRRTHFHDFTVHSQSVPVDVRKGGLKKDLTAFFESEGKVANLGPALGLSDDDNIIGPANQQDAKAEGLAWDSTRHRFTSPKFGLFRRWARLGRDIPFIEAEVDGIVPKSEPKVRRVAMDGMASSNLTPATIAQLDSPNLMPVLVEGSMYSIVSWHRNPEGAAFPYNIRLHVYPRIVLWNPYNVELKVKDMMALLHVNGRKEMHTDGIMKDPVTGRNRFVRAQWIWFVGGRSSELRDGQHILDSKLYNDPYMGSFYFSLETTTIGAGECLVFSPTGAAEYNRRALENNVLSASYSPSADRNFYFTSSELDGGMNFYPTSYWFAPSKYWDIKNQSDDFRMILKHRGTQNEITPEKFDELAQISFVSCSIQFGAGREPRLAWNELNKEQMYETDLRNARWLPRPGQPARPLPNVRTRDGYRLRWFDEHQSNMINAGALSDEPHFDTAHIANWNPRASYSFRTPWDNLAGQVAATGSGPWFFGAYTRDLFDQAVSWDDMMPVPRGGLWHGNPFGQPIEGRARNILFDVPRKDTGVISLAQLQHVKLSEFSWHPSYAVAQSLVDPRVGTGSTAPRYGGDDERDLNGWTPKNIGWSNDAQRSTDREAWARFGRALAQNYAETDQLVYDQSYEANYSLWDTYFLSSGRRDDRYQFVEDPVANPLPNGRHVLAPSTRSLANVERLNDLHRSAYHLLVDGGFNVNSTSVDAWKALLASTRNAGYGVPNRTPFPRVLDAPEGELVDADSMHDAAWAGFRSLSDDELDTLALEVVRQVKLRGPFLSLADFVNRRLTDDPSDERGHCGALQAAIEAAGLNRDFVDTVPLDREEPLSDYHHPDNVTDSTRLEQTLKPKSKAWGAPGYLTQGDLLQVIGPAISARSDSFVIRTYGDAVDANGDVLARAWCEAIVQRTPVPVRPDESGINPQLDDAPDFGRRFKIKSFRWLNSDEI